MESCTWNKSKLPFRFRISLITYGVFFNYLKKNHVTLLYNDPYFNPFFTPIFHVIKTEGYMFFDSADDYYRYLDLLLLEKNTFFQIKNNFFILTTTVLVVLLQKFILDIKLFNVVFLLKTS